MDRSDTRNQLIEYFEGRKRDCERDLRYAETTPGFRLFQVVAGGKDVDITAQHIESLRRACNEYQRATEYLREP